MGADREATADLVGLPDITLADVVLELRRIADAVAKPAACYGQQDGAVCALNDSHVGYHVTADGRTHWLDKE